ncbi:restriction endonuclease subunit S [Paenibacillus polymyxa]|uniref:restriction endonuclease subunit S n=1 Tax=Paenibacillus polymyxa TaxID=1406 RepID=UPI0004D5ED13|nr:restriction endonuclease subunit S [Paenibacillus polymyxa]KEO78169.1 restriction endonuclease subunit S [Paenibacillus polymyxa]MCH6189699.1 restriction endonuclease subunit S [Paenibacillus polymyxa]WRL61048.1 restriction endonuclease subunit S [Paenibacillus polymyxa]
MSENKENTPKIRFPGFTDAWEQRRLGELMEISSASRVHKEEWTETGVPFFRSSDVVSAFKGLENDRAFISYELFEELSNKSGKVQENDLLVTGGGSIGIPYKVRNNEPLYFKDADLIWFKNSSLINSDFLYTFLITPVFRRYVGSITHIGTISHYTIEQAKATPIMMPEIEEQKHISQFFAQLDRLITLHQRKLNNVKNLKDGLLQKMFPKNGEDFPEVRFPGFTGAWEQRELGKLGDTFTGLSGKTKEDFGHGDAQFVTYVNVFGNVISDPNGVENVEIDDKQNQVKYGDVFFTTSSETPEEVGMSSVWLENTENVYLNSFCFGYRPTVEFEPYYLAFMLRSPEIRKKFILLAQGISRYNISKSKVMEMKVPVPKLNEQRKVGAFFRDLDHLITLHQRKLEHLQEQKKALLQQMFI